MSVKRPTSGKTLGLGPPEGQAWVWVTRAMLGCLTYKALGIHARRILDFLLHEHAGHAGLENGNLAAPYQQLEDWGVTAADVRKGFAELTTAGFVRLTKQGMRTAGGGQPSRYALTWIPTHWRTSEQGPPTHEWLDVMKNLADQKISTVVEARRWLRTQTEDVSRNPTRKQKPTPHLQGISPINCEANGRI